ncbi:MAG TPA: molybdopterin-dependent oxidoreductase [Anaerolineaceae bacterium]|nr:molybdopterin-dependent oxidoreductase [Anaerolineaceae bacterium]
MVNITIDDKKIEVPDGTTVLQAARMADIHIPTLCNHPHLTPYGGCRMCLVEVEGARTLQPSCTLPAGNNMVVHTDTPKTREARKFVLTLLFSERNHFCMYCQKSGGDCELQNCAYGEGMTHWPLPPNWQAYKVDASHPYYVMDHNRCILCRRCVRACGELAGNFTLGFEDRGANSILVADLGNPLGESTCVSCGTCVQVCPTGALIDRKSAYLGKDVQTEKTKSICLGCSLGCGIDVHTRDNQLVRIDGDWDAAVNGGILCMTGRFEPTVEERERIVTPLVRKNGALKAATWNEALFVVSEKLASLKGLNGSGVAALVSTRLPAEALHLFKQVFADVLQSKVVTSIEEGAYTAASTKVAKELGKPFEGTLADLEMADSVMAFGIDLVEDHQVAGFFIKRNLPKGTKLVVVDSQRNAMSDLAQLTLKPAARTEIDLIEGLAAAVALLNSNESALGGVLTGASLETAPQTTGVSAQAYLEAARLITAAENPVLIYGKGLAGNESALKALVEFAAQIGAKVIAPKGQANSVAAAQYGLEGTFEINGQKAVFIALGDDELSKTMQQRLEAVPFLVVASSYVNAATAKADVVLPVEMWAEVEGHYVNSEGRLQTAAASLTAPEGVLSSQKILAEIAARLGATPSVDWRKQLALPQLN